MNDNSEIGYFTKDTIPLLRALVRKRWAEGNPICVGDPMEYMIPYYTDLLAPIIAKEMKDRKEEQC